MNKYLLDTDICSYIIKKRPREVLERFKAVSPMQLGISVITLAELLYGVEHSSSKTINLPIIENFVNHLQVLPWESEAAVHYSKLRVLLEQQGTPIGNMDLMIAAHALSLGRIVVTNNLRHFEKVPYLQVENWTTS